MGKKRNYSTDTSDSAQTSDSQRDSRKNHNRKIKHKDRSDDRKSLLVKKPNRHEDRYEDRPSKKHRKEREYLTEKNEKSIQKRRCYRKRSSSSLDSNHSSEKHEKRHHRNKANESSPETSHHRLPKSSLKSSSRIRIDLREIKSSRSSNHYSSSKSRKEDNDSGALKIEHKFGKKSIKKTKSESKMDSKRADKESDEIAASQKIEEAMLKRRERIERWRKGRKQKSPVIIEEPLEEPLKESIDDDKWFSEDDNTEEVTDKTEVDKTDMDKTEVDKTEVDKTEVNKTEVNKTEVDKTEVDKTEVDKTEVDKTEVDKTEVDKMDDGKINTDKKDTKLIVQPGMEENKEIVQQADEVKDGIEENVDESVDPLDEYMSMISQQIKSLNQTGSHVIPQPADKQSEEINDNEIKTTKAVIVRTKFEKKKVIDKGYIMEQNADALEYSSEDYSDDDDLFSYRKSKADCINTDHNKIYYRRFRKRFYNEVPEISNLTREEVAQLRYDLDNVQVTGRKCPKPIKSWAQCVTYMSLLDTLKRLGMLKPTPIQAQALPIIASGRDMIGIAKTGSGKTLAFLLPMFRHIKAQPPLESEDGPISMIVTPTRELAMQIAKECRRFCKILDIRVVAVYGGTGISEQIADLKRGTEIVVCTPGRMIDMIAANNGKVTNLRRVTYVVIDEADRMFDMGFEPQVNKILECIRPDRQTVMFSATFPRQMESLARRALRKPIEVVVGGRSVVCEEVEQHVSMLNEDQKYLKLLELLGIYHEHGSVLVFVHKQEHADELMKNLMHSSYSCLALHGGIDQYDRDSVISDFKSGTVRILIATSVAARGLDVREIILVVNYDCPNHYEDYVHRCGRTGRAGRRGVAYTFITPFQGKIAGDVIKALEQSNVKVCDELKELWNTYKSKMEEEGILIKSGPIGFGGKGFKFDSEEQAFSDDRRRVQKVMFGMQDSDDEDCVDIDHEIDKTFKSRTRVKNPVDGIAGDASDEIRNSNAEKLAFAKILAAKIGQSRSEFRSILSNPTIASVINASASIPFSGKSIAEQIAGKLNNKLNYVPKERDMDNDPDQVNVYEEELEINDFPQNARWKVTSKETLSHIAEYAEAALTVRGKYFPSGKQPPPGESRLYLIIEALTERGLQLAKAEIKRIIKEEMMKMQNPALQIVNRGRYKVM